MLRLEQPTLRTQSIDVPHMACVEVSSLLCATTPEAELACGAAMRLAARLRVCTATSKSSGASLCGPYVVTGGLGGLGLRAAALLVKGGACCVLM